MELRRDDFNIYLFRRIRVQGIKREIYSLIVTILLVGIAIGGMFYLNRAIANHTKYKDMIVADFRTDVNKLSEVARVIEASRLTTYKDVKAFGGTGGFLENEIREDLKHALVNFADSNNDKKLSREELTNLGIMKLDKKIFLKELEKNQLNDLYVDRNLNNYIVITKGEHQGTILYNGTLKFENTKGERYFGIEMAESIVNPDI